MATNETSATLDMNAVFARLGEIQPTVEAAKANGAKVKVELSPEDKERLSQIASMRKEIRATDEFRAIAKQAEEFEDQYASEHFGATWGEIVSEERQLRGASANVPEVDENNVLLYAAGVGQKPRNLDQIDTSEFSDIGAQAYEVALTKAGL